MRRLLDDLASQRVGGLEGVASGCALNEMRTLHEPARCHDGRCRGAHVWPPVPCGPEKVLVTLMDAWKQPRAS